MIIDPGAVRAQADLAMDVRAADRLLNALRDAPAPPVDQRCESCRAGHYDDGNGALTNLPCTGENCTCFYCGKPR